MVNESAPAVAVGEIEVDAEPEVVWDVMAGIEAWPMPGRALAMGVSNRAFLPGQHPSIRG
jgi:hypothetical protein